MKVINFIKGLISLCIIFCLMLPMTFDVAAHYSDINNWISFGNGVTFEKISDGTEHPDCLKVVQTENGASFWQKDTIVFEKNKLYKITADIKLAPELVQANVPVYFEAEPFEKYGDNGAVEVENTPVMSVRKSGDLHEDWHTITAYYRYNGVCEELQTRIAVGINGGFIPAGVDNIQYYLDNFAVAECDESIYSIRNEAGGWIFNSVGNTYIKENGDYLSICSDTVCDKVYQPILIKKDANYYVSAKVRTNADTTGAIYIDNRGFGDNGRTTAASNIEFKADQWTDIYAEFKYSKSYAENGGGNIYFMFDNDISQYDISDFKVFYYDTAINNSDFSQGTKFWSVSGAKTVNDAEKGNCLEIIPNENSFCSISQRIGLEKDRWYILKALVKVNETDTVYDDNGNVVLPTVKFNMPGYYVGENLGATYLTPGEWTEVYTCFKYTGDNDVGTFMLRAGQSSAGKILYDTVKNGIRIAYAQVSLIDEQNIVVAGDFENEYLVYATSSNEFVNRWHNSSDVYVDPYYGLYAQYKSNSIRMELMENNFGNETQFLHISSDNWITLTPTQNMTNGQKYLIYADVRAADENATIDARFYMTESASSSDTIMLSSDKWTRIVYCYTPTTDTKDNLQLRIGQNKNTGNINGVYIDNFTVIPIENSSYVDIYSINGSGMRAPIHSSDTASIEYIYISNTDKDLNLFIAYYEGDRLNSVIMKDISAKQNKAATGRIDNINTDLKYKIKAFMFDKNLKPECESIVLKEERVDD